MSDEAPAREPHDLASRRSRPRVTRWLVALVIFLGPAGAFVGWTALSRWRANAYGQDAVSALSYCLYGEVPSSGATEALRAVAIGGDISGDRTWPGRCEPFLRSSERAVDVLRARAKERCNGACCAGDVRCARLEALRGELGRLRPYFAVGDAAGFDATTFATLSGELGLVGGDRGGVEAPPDQARMIDHRSMRPLYEGDYLRLLTDPMGDDSLSLLFYEEGARYDLCDIQLESGASRCRPLSPAIPVDLAGELLAGDPGSPRRMYAQGKRGDAWLHAIFDVTSGEQVAPVSDRPDGGFVWPDAAVAYLEGGPPAKLHRLQAGKALPPVPITTADEVSSAPRLIWDEVVWAEPTDDGRHRVLAQRAIATGETIGPLVYLGQTPVLENKPSIEVCRTSEVLALLVGGNAEDGGVDAVLLVRDQKGWRTPAEVHIDAIRFGFTCRGDTTTLSWIVGAEELPDLTFLGDVDNEDSLPVDGIYRVHRLRCGDGHCAHDHTKLPLRRFSRTSRYVAGDAGDAMVVLWRSVLGDVRAKVAPLAQLAEAPARAVFDDVEHAGFGWDLERDPIIGRGGRVVVLLSRQIGTTEESATYGFVVQEEGDILPLRVGPNERN